MRPDSVIRRFRIPATAGRECDTRSYASMGEPQVGRFEVKSEWAFLLARAYSDPADLSPPAVAKMLPGGIVQQPVAQLPEPLPWSVPWGTHLGWPAEAANGFTEYGARRSRIAVSVEGSHRRFY